MEEQKKTSSENLVKATCEEWKPVKGYEEYYEISNLGRVRSLDRIVTQKNRWGQDITHLYKGKVLTGDKAPNGYLSVDFRIKGHIKRKLVHRLVAEHFLDKPNGKDYINHLDCNPTNNRVENLEWCTQSENIQYAYDNGTKTPPHQKKVEQYDMDGNLIKVWESIAQAVRGCGCKNIRKVCIGERTKAGGFIWKYAQ